MSIFTNRLPIILASASPRRHELLSSLGVKFSICPSDAEPAPLAGEAPQDYAARAALCKARDVSAKQAPERQARAILAADTIVVLDGKIIGKPSTHQDALRMLMSLGGRTHTVYTACAMLLSLGNGETPAEYKLIEESRVTMHAWPRELLEIYANSDEPMDKAGAYAVQGQGSFLIESISGSWSNVVGLPLSQVCALLLEHGIITPGGPKKQPA